MTIDLANDHWSGSVKHWPRWPHLVPATRPPCRPHPWFYSVTSSTGMLMFLAPNTEADMQEPLSKYFQNHAILHHNEKIRLWTIDREWVKTWHTSICSLATFYYHSMTLVLHQGTRGSRMFNFPPLLQQGKVKYSIGSLCALVQP